MFWQKSFTSNVLPAATLPIYSAWDRHQEIMECIPGGWISRDSLHVRRINPPRPVVLILFYPMNPFNPYSQIKSPLRNLVCKKHFYIGALRKETKLFTIDKLFSL